MTPGPAAAPTWPALLTALSRGQALPTEDAVWAMTEIMSGSAGPAPLAAFLVALRAKGETAEEVAALVSVMLEFATPLVVPDDIRARAVDTCGTGGDGAGFVNISTMAAFVVAGADVPVIKHGNRAASSACGSADLLGELGVVADLPAAAVAACLDAAGAAFCFAPAFHPAMRHVGPVRAAIGVPTVFNILGPLTNPGRPAAQALGVADGRLAPIMAEVLAARGVRGLVFRGDDGVDELTPAAAATVWVVAGGRVRPDRFDPRELGIERVEPAALRGADAVFNAGVARDLLAGRPGPVREAVLLTAAASLVAADGPSNAPVVEQIAAALPRAAASVDSGAAAEALGRWTTASQKAAANLPASS
jgi:anthranilate phosphoribosyltransferase